MSGGPPAPLALPPQGARSGPGGGPGTPDRLGAVRGPRARRRFAGPATGWTSLFVLAAMLLVAGLAMDQPRVAGMGPNGSQTAFLPVVLVLAGAVGAALGLLRLPPGPAHLLGSILGAGVLVVSWGWAISGDPSLAGRLSDVNAAAATLFDDVVVRGGRTQETIGFLIVVGSIAWTTGYFAAYNLCRRGLVAPAIVAVGTVVLVVSLSPPVEVGELYLHLVILTGLALLLALRANLAHQQAGWRRRHIVGGRGVERPFLRGGALVCAAALAGASVLAANVVAAPLSEVWTRLDQRLLDLAGSIDALFGGIGSGEDIPSGSFGDRARIADTWRAGDTLVFTAIPGDERPHYWTGATYSRFDGSAWDRAGSLESTVAVAASRPLLEGTADTLGDLTAFTREVTLTVTSVTMDGRSVLSPATPWTVDRDAYVTLDGPGGPLGEIEFRADLRPGDSYRVVALVPRSGDDGLTQSMLAAAGRSYPEWARRYTEIAEGTLSDQARGQAEQLEDSLSAARQDPFHVAQLMEAWFSGTGRFASDPAFSYATDIQGRCLPLEGVVDCLLRIREGFCQHYATAMTLMLRSRAIPARYVQGYLPGQRLADGAWQVPIAAAHAWVEVYFPGHGWVRFDPTPGGNARNGQTTSDLPVGEPLPPSTSPGPAAPDATPVFSDPPPIPSPTPPATSPPPDERDLGAGFLGLDLPWPLLLLLLAIGVAATTVLIAVARWRRLPGRSPDVLYRAIASFAARLGHGPRPEQTAYEFTASLAEAIPAVTRDLHAVARAKVEATYGAREPAGDALDALVENYRRARRALVGLVLRRPGRR